MSQLNISDGFVVVDIQMVPKALEIEGIASLIFLTEEALLLGNNPLTLSERVRRYDSLDDILEEQYPENSEIMKVFRGYYADRKNLGRVYLGAIGDTVNSTSSHVIGGNLQGELNKIQAITSGHLKFTIGTTLYELGNAVSGFDLSGVSDFSDVKTVLETLLNTANIPLDVILESVGGAQQLKFITQAQGSDTALSYFQSDNNTAEVLKIDIDHAVEREIGSDPDSPSKALEECLNINSGFLGVVVDKKFNDTTEIDKLADVVIAHEKQLFVNTYDPRTINKKFDENLADHSGECIAARLKDKGSSRIHVVYTDQTNEYPASEVAGLIYNVDLDGTDTMITVMYKRLFLCPPTNIGAKEKRNLLSNSANIYSNVEKLPMFFEGRQSDDSFLDSTFIVDTLGRAIESNVFNLLYTADTKVPYNDEGVARLKDAVTETLEGFVLNGSLQEFLVEADAVGDVSPKDKGNRVYQGIRFEAKGSGAIHNVIIKGTFEE